MWANSLITWYKKHQRSLPWRKSPHPYHTLICEFMAQQTQINTLIPYYERWLEKYPTISDVAKATEDDILKSWEGLGYYSRARNLQKTCKLIVENHNRRVPKDPDILLTLPGIGPYIAAAVASIAYDVPIAVVDGNVLRVMTRLYGLSDDIGKDKTKKNIQNRLNQIIKSTPPSEFNQGVMELGATICTPKNPHCPDCPIQNVCYAKNMNKIDQFPVKQKKPPTPHHTIVVGIITRDDGKILITKRKKDQLLGGLWEFPGGKVKEAETLESATIREIKEEVNIDITINGFLCKVKHAYSHFKITLHAYHCKPIQKNPRITCSSADDYQWVRPNELDQLAFPKANKVIISHLTESI